MTEFKLKCCEGSGQSCHKDLCPHFRKAEQEVKSAWPYEGTGFGNLYGNPGVLHFLAQVSKDLGIIPTPQKSAVPKKKRMNRPTMTFQEWVVKRRTQRGDNDNLFRHCKVSERVKKLPCGCKPNSDGEIFVRQEFNSKTGMSIGWSCGMNKKHTQIF